MSSNSKYSKREILVAYWLTVAISLRLIWDNIIEK